LGPVSPDGPVAPAAPAFPTKSPSAGVHKPTWKPSTKPIESDPYHTTTTTTTTTATAGAAARNPMHQVGEKDKPLNSAESAAAMALRAAAANSGANPARTGAPRGLSNVDLTTAEVDRLEQEAFAHAREDMHLHRVVDLAVNARLDLKWIGDALERVRGELEPAYVEEMEASMMALKGHIAAAEHDARAVDANAFQQAKEALDRLSVRVHEVAIARSLRG